MKAVGYIRVSTEEQADSGRSLDAQKRRIEEWCAARKYELVQVFADEGVSASIALKDRPAGGQLLRWVHSTRSDVAVVSVKLDRLSRNTRHFLELVEDSFRGISLYLLDFSGDVVNTASPSGKLVITMMAAVAESERAMTIERVRFTMQDMKKRGLRVGDLPYGKQLGANNQLEEHPEEAAIVRHILTARESGLSIRRIAAVLNESGIPARSPRWRLADLELDLEPEAAGALDGARCAGFSGTALVNELNKGVTPPRDGHWNKSSVHHILRGTRAPKSRVRRRVGLSDGEYRVGDQVIRLGALKQLRGRVRVCATRVELLHFGMHSGTVARLVEEAGTRRTVFTTQSAEVIRAFCTGCGDRDFRVMRVDFDDGRMKEPVSYSAADALSALDAGWEIRG
jgi:DNA invertase Pin-like site-specific DNA recombinase